MKPTSIFIAAAVAYLARGKSLAATNALIIVNMRGLSAESFTTIASKDVTPHALSTQLRRYT